MQIKNAFCNTNSQCKFLLPGFLTELLHTHCIQVADHIYFRDTLSCGTLIYNKYLEMQLILRDLRWGDNTSPS
jgi:hypothetical protein